MDWIFHKSTIVFFYKMEGMEFSKMHRIFRVRVFLFFFFLCFRSLQYFFASLPEIIPVKWLYSSRICHSLEKEACLWKNSSEEAGGLKLGRIYSFLWLIFWIRWMTCTLKWLFSSTSIPKADEILFALYVTLLPNGILFNLNIFLWVPLHLTSSKHFCA